VQLKAKNMNSGTRKRPLDSSSGFTLLELVLAMLISSLVIGILSVSLTFTLRVWEKQQNQKTSDMPPVLDLLKWQLASYDPSPIVLDASSQPLFRGDKQSLTLATDRSVRAISNNVPVVARYIFDKRKKKLYYAEIPLDSYHPDDIKAFLKMKPSDDEAAWPRFYATDAASFSLAYGSGEDKTDKDAWENETDPPATVMVKWSPWEGAPLSTQLYIPNFLFPRKNNASQQGNVSGTQQSGAAPLQANGGMSPTGE